MPVMFEEQPRQLFTVIVQNMATIKNRLYLSRGVQWDIYNMTLDMFTNLNTRKI
jgi:hypothetical protein